MLHVSWLDFLKRSRGNRWANFYTEPQRKRYKSDSTKKKRIWNIQEDKENLIYGEWQIYNTACCASRRVYTRNRKNRLEMDLRYVDHGLQMKWYVSLSYKPLVLNPICITDLTMKIWKMYNPKYKFCTVIYIVVLRYSPKPNVLKSWQLGLTHS